MHVVNKGSRLRVAVLAAAGSMLVTPQAQDRQEAPEWVREILAKQFGHAELLDLDREDDHFEAELRRNDDSRRLEVDLNEDSGVTDIDEDLEPEHLPDRIVQSLKRAFPKAHIKKGIKNTDIHISYKVFITSDGRKREVRISPRGKILEIEKGD